MRRVWILVDGGWGLPWHLMQPPPYEFVASLMDHAVLAPASTHAESGTGRQNTRRFSMARSLLRDTEMMATLNHAPRIS